MNQTTKEYVLSELKKRSENKEPISGQRLAEKIGVSRNAIWKAMKQLKTDGYIITASRNTGYLLCPQSDVLDKYILNSYLKDLKEVRCYFYKDIDSTNNEAKRLLLQNKRPPFLVVAEEQTAGKGRLGRDFYSPAKTGVYLSLVIEPELNLNAPITITAAAAVAVAESIKELTGKEVQIKWVNDIFLEGKKVCGILTEATADIETATIKNIIIGIGINLKPSDFPTHLSEIAGSIGDVKIERAELIANITKRLLDFVSREDNVFLDEYRNRSCVIGKMIDFYYKGNKKSAYAMAIDEQGGLIVRLPDGTIQTLSSGEISVRVQEV